MVHRFWNGNIDYCRDQRLLDLGERASIDVQDFVTQDNEIKLGHIHVLNNDMYTVSVSEYPAYFNNHVCMGKVLNLLHVNLRFSFEE
jgi:hypothetical protein